MTGLFAVGLVVLALTDGAFSGFRSSVGRTGLIRHAESDRIACRRGAGLVIALLVPAFVVCAVDVVLLQAPVTKFAQAAEVMLAVYMPYAVTVLLALAAYVSLGWRHKYLASTLILGPFTLIRPVVALTGAMAGVFRTTDLIVTAVITLATLAVLTVEPLTDRIWYEDTATHTT